MSGNFMRDKEALIIETIFNEKVCLQLLNIHELQVSLLAF